jgi:hypothetical protein
MDNFSMVRQYRHDDKGTAARKYVLPSYFQSVMLVAGPESHPGGRLSRTDGYCYIVFLGDAYVNSGGFNKEGRRECGKIWVTFSRIDE